MKSRNICAPALAASLFLTSCSGEITAPQPSPTVSAVERASKAYDNCTITAVENTKITTTKLGYTAAVLDIMLDAPRNPAIEGNEANPVHYEDPTARLAKFPTEAVIAWKYDGEQASKTQAHQFVNLHTLGANLHGHEDMDIFVKAIAVDTITAQTQTALRFCGELAIDGTVQGVTSARIEQPIHAVPPIQTETR